MLFVSFGCLYFELPDAGSLCLCGVLVRNGVAEGRIPLTSPISPYFVTVTEELMPLHTSRLGFQSSQCWEMCASLTFRTPIFCILQRQTGRHRLSVHTHSSAPVPSHQAQNLTLAQQVFLATEPDAQPWNVSPGI